MEPIRILLAEDNINDAELTLRALKKCGIENSVYHAHDGLAALEYLRSNQVGLILLDINMPKMDGIDLLKHLKRDPKFKRIPAVILTGSSGDVTLLEGYQNGIDSYIIKPLTAEKFLRAALDSGVIHI